MGCGASAGVAEKMAAASDADLKEAIAGLTVESREKLLAALDAAHGVGLSPAEPAAAAGAAAAGESFLAVTVTLVSGVEKAISVPRDATVFDLRKAIEVADLCPMPCQRLILGAEELKETGQRVSELECLELMLVVGVSHGIAEIHLRTGDVVDYICLKRRDGSTSECGNRGGSEREPFLMEPHEYITEVAWWGDDYYGSPCLKGVRFTTNTGRVSGVYGHDSENWESERAPQGQQISGLRMTRDHRGYVRKIEEVIME